MPGFNFAPTAVHANPSPAGLAGLPSWFWLDPQPSPVTSVASGNGYQYSITATPESTAWAFGDGGSLQLPGAAGYGQAYPQSSSVAWTYEAEAPSYQVTAVETYAVTWTAQAGGVTYGPYPLGTVDGPPAVLSYPVQQAEPELLR
jgi:hypothetical protein